MESENDSNYFFDVTYHKRMFKGQTSGPKVFSEKICANTKTDVQGKIYESSKEFMLRQIVFVENEGKRAAEWSENLHPTNEDAKNYIIFQDKSKSKKTYKFDEVNENLFKSWRFKEIGVLIHVHSLSVECNADYELAKNGLLMPAERDRSGAHTTEAIVLLAKRLEETHIYLEGDPVSWKIWANYVHASNAGDRESLIEQLPPRHIGENFRFKTASSGRLSAAQEELSAARNLNQGYAPTIRQIRESFNALAENVKVLGMQIEILENRNVMENHLITAVRGSVSPNENNHSRHISGTVTDHQDIDHP